MLLGRKPTAAFVESFCWKTSSWRSRGQRSEARGHRAGQGSLPTLTPENLSACEEAPMGPCLCPGPGAAGRTGSQGRPGGWDAGWSGPEPGMRQSPTPFWPQSHRHTGHPPDRKPCPAPPLSHPVFPAGGASTISRGSCCQESYPLEKGSRTSGSQAALPLTCTDPLLGPPTGRSFGPTPMPHPTHADDLSSPRQSVTFRD